MSGTQPKVAIIHPWFPQYREPFFARLHDLCAAAGVSLEVYYGDPPPEWRERGDSVAGPLANHLTTRFFSVRGRSLGHKSLGEFHRRGPYDLVILEQAIRNLESYRLLASPRYGHRIAWWGHGGTYTQRRRSVEEKLKKWLTRRGRWFFAYTDGGVREVTNQGFSPERVTSVGNSIDTAALRADLGAVTDDQLLAFRAAHDLRGKTALFIGGLDESKRLPFLFDAGVAVHERQPDFRLLIAGNGEQRDAVERFAADHPWCVYLGARFGADKAIPMRAADVLVMPGRVGLAAVDSFAAGLPIVTTDWPYHAPEFDYLTPDVNAVVSPNTSTAYANSLVELLATPVQLDAMKNACLKLAGEYDIESMASRFFEGIAEALSAGRA
jgi:glycosyltransferase involved in cell wall biosynthesis